VCRLTPAAMVAPVGASGGRSTSALGSTTATAHTNCSASNALEHAVRGLRTRGRLSINIKWQDRSLIEATMRPSIAGLVKLRASSREFVRTNQRGQVVSLPDSGIECSFMAQSGEHYFLRRGTSQ
jgi:hypothetical protein